MWVPGLLVYCSYCLVSLKRSNSEMSNGDSRGLYRVILAPGLISEDRRIVI
jgi:hypothetical protein